jgi:hypothetical protein
MALPTQLMNPPLMAIGDSLYNGMRSATIDASKTRLSPPALIAQGLGIGSFKVPDLPQPVIVDLERWIEYCDMILQVPVAVAKIRQEMRESIRVWATGDANVPSPGGHQVFDNISFAGSTLQDMYELTAEKADTRARELAAAALAAQDFAGLANNVGDLLVNANARFTLAPDPDVSDANPFRRRTSLEIVAMRQPERLLVSIGHNNGLIDIVLRGEPAGAAHLAAQCAKYYPELIRQLCTLPSSVKAIYVNLLPAPSAVSSLMPTSTDKTSEELGSYFGSYETRVCYRYGTYKGKRLHEIDKEVLALNQWIVEQFRTADTQNRVHCVDVFRRMKAIDSKNNGRTASNTFLVGSKTCTNECFEAHPFFPGGAGFKAGGLEGLDGVHLTTLGNAIVANWVLDEIAANEGIAVNKVSLSAIGAQDTLVANPPNGWSWILWAYRDIMRAKASGTTHNRSSMEVAAAEHTGGLGAAVARRMALVKDD